MAEAAKGINPQITPEEVKEVVKEATAEVVEKAPSLASSEKMRSIVVFDRYTFDRYTLYAMAATLLLAVICFLIGLTGNPLSYAPIPYSALH
jgi:hypothetical protein